MDRSFLIDDPKLVDDIVHEVKSQGVFDQFRRNCIADVDTKPAYQNLRQRVENIVSNFLNEQEWRADLNKNQLREKLRKHITDAGFLETGVERIVDQVVNPKINSIFLPKIEDISYKYLGIEKPKQTDEQSLNSGNCIGSDSKSDTLPTELDLDDLEAVSPDSTSSKKSFKDLTENLNTSNIDSNKTDLNDSGEKTEDDFESPAFEPLKSCLLTDPDSINGDDNSKLSDISGLTSQDSVNGAVVEIETETKATAPTIEIVEQPAVTQSQQVIPENINQDSVLSQVSSNSHLSIVTDSNNKSSEVDICEEAQMPKFSENSCNNPDMDDKDKKPLLTSFDIKQDEIIFEGTERHSAIHDLKDDVKMEVDDSIEEFKDSAQILDLMGDESLIKTESSSSLMDPIISETKDLSVKDECKSVDSEFKFEEPILSVDTADVSANVSNQSQNNNIKSKDSKPEKRSDGKYEHKSHRRDKSSSSHHSREKHKDNDRKHSSSSSKHSSNSSSARKDHRSESRETKKSSSSDHRRDESSKSTDRSSVKTMSSSHSSSRDKDGNYKSSRSHSDDKHDKSNKDRTDKEKSDKSRPKQDRSSNNKSRSQHRSSEDKIKHRSHDDGKRKSGQDSTTRPKMIDDHASHREKHNERRRSTDRDSNDGSAPPPPKPSSTNTQTEVGSVDSSAISHSTSFSSKASTGTDDRLKREIGMHQQNAVEEIERSATSPTDSVDNFVPSSVPVVVDQMLIGNDINLEMLMDTSTMATNEINPVISMIAQSLNDSNEIKIKKPKVASNIYEARKLMKVRKQIQRDEEKRLEKLLVHTKQTVAATQYGVDEQGVELEFALTSSSAPSISSPVKSKDIPYDGLQVPAPVSDKRNSGEFIIDMKEMEKELKSGKLSPKKGDRTPTTQRFVHKFDEILSQIDKPRKRESKGGASPASPNIDKSPKFESPHRKLMREQSLEAVTLVDNKRANNLMTNAPSRQCRDEKKGEKSFPETIQDSSNLKKNSECSKSVISGRSHSPPMLEQKIRKSNKSDEKKGEKSFTETIQDCSNSKKNSECSKSVISGRSHSPPMPEQKIRQSNKIVTSSTPASAVKQSKYDSIKHQKSATTSSKITIKDSSKAKSLNSIDSQTHCSTQNVSPTDDENVNDDKFNETDEFYGFSAEVLLGKTENDFVKFREMYAAKIKDETIYLINCDPKLCDALVKLKKNVCNVIGNEIRLISKKHHPNLSKQMDPKQCYNQVSDENTFEIKEMKTNIGSVNGARTTTAQHKLFVENNLFSDNTDGQKVSRKRKNSEGGQGTASKLVKLADPKMNSRDNTDVPTSGEISQTPSEQLKENQIHQMKKPIAGRVADNVCTSNDFTTDQDQHPTGRIGSNNKPNQRYAADDLYKPRPVLSRTRRRGLENGEN